ncbi:MAG: hypothetical protein Q7R32_04125 [Dehalococcoidia bacterium]|nr:hypothetical protein [Dehalococcoidia bacterium]
MNSQKTVLLAAALLASATLAACGGGSVTPTNSKLPSTSPIGSYEDQYDFRSFGAELEGALARRDLQFFLENVSLTDVSCGEESPRPPSSCTGKASESSVPAILVGVWEGEDFYLDMQGYEEFILEFLTEYAAGETDSYGGAEPRLYAYAVIRREFAFAPSAVETVEAIATRIRPGPPSERQALLVTIGFDGERWAVTQMVVGPATFLESAGPRPPGEAAAETIFEFWAPWED